FDICPQRDELQPTMGGAVVLEGMRWLFGRVSYRRTVSRSPGLIGPADRFEEPDTGFYPNEDGQRPDWGVNEEKLTASLRAVIDLGDERRLVPFGAVRYSAVHGLVDEAHLGTRLRFRSHSIEPELFYSFPTFDGDSIFNVFSIQPYWDLRATYSLWSPSGRLSGYLRPWARRFSVEDPSNAQTGERVAGADWAGGVHAGGQLRFRRREHLRLDGFAEDGYGGRRIGGMAAGRWFVTPALGLATRLSIIDFQDELLEAYDGLNLGAQLGLSYQIFAGVGFKTLAEYNHNRIGDHQLRMFAILDLAFRPEL
ncbi:MAG: hypothetical protein KJO07_20275, partial [Deltaproteobacteria bacterium]|nr:hypothetical protein [Deltaproteobacteria bacterium]